jgi:hypothetical protein
MAEEQTCKVGLALAPLAIEKYNDVWLYIFRKYKTFSVVVLCVM